MRDVSDSPREQGREGGKGVVRAGGGQGGGIFWRETDGVGGAVWEAVAIKIFKTSILQFRDRERYTHPHTHARARAHTHTNTQTHIDPTVP